MLKEVACYKCKEKFGLDYATYETLCRSHAGFCCPWGHQQAFLEGESEEDKLRRERNYLKQQVAQKDDEIRMWRATADDQAEQAKKERSRANGYKGHATRITKRAKAGVCPCCNRSFENLRRHMASQHPKFTPIEIDEGAPQHAH